MDDFKAELAESFWEIERSNKVLRTKKDRDGDRWSEVAPDVWYSTPPMSLCELEEEFGPLTDVTDTGEPLDTDDDFVLADEEERARQVAAFCDRMAEEDTLRKPEHGDTVSVTLRDENGSTVVGKYVKVPADAEKGQGLIDGDGFLLRVFLKDVTVIEPARPAVPEEPPVGTVVIDGSGDAWQHNYDGWSNTQGGTRISWLDVLFDSPLYKVERGPVIGG